MLCYNLQADHSNDWLCIPHFQGYLAAFTHGAIPRGVYLIKAVIRYRRRLHLHMESRTANMKPFVIDRDPRYQHPVIDHHFVL